MIQKKVKKMNTTINLNLKQKKKTANKMMNL